MTDEEINKLTIAECIEAIKEVKNKEANRKVKIASLRKDIGLLNNKLEALEGRDMWCSPGDIFYLEKRLIDLVLQENNFTPAPTTKVLD